MGQRDFLLKEEKIDKLPLRAQKHFYVQHYGTPVSYTHLTLPTNSLV